MTASPPLGHDFGEDLRCPCGTTWRNHQADPKPCERKVLTKFREQNQKGAGAPVRSRSDDALARLRVALGLPVSSVAAAVGVSSFTVSQAERGHVGGKGMASQDARDRIEAFLVDCKGDD